MKTRRIELLFSWLIIITSVFTVGYPTLDAQRSRSGDDDQLIFSHALVNHPSFDHTLKLFYIIHRDLYQPLPLLTFQLEFAIHGGQLFWLHFTNVVIHLINTLLVWWLLRRWLLPRESASVYPSWSALVGALFFAVHPLAVEGYAWLNGRMMMMSALFSILTVILFDIGTERLKTSNNTQRSLRYFVMALFTALLAMLSKVQIGLPLLLLIIPMWRRFRPTWRWWSWWSRHLLIAFAFALLNIYTTRESRMFEGAEQQLLGSNIARSIMALAWYVQHYVWPSGLSPYYPPPKLVLWSDTAVWWSAAICCVVVVAALWTWKRNRVGLLGLWWFGATIVATLPLLGPSRNLMVADRYVYLPIVGFHWIVIVALSGLTHRIRIARAEARGALNNTITRMPNGTRISILLLVIPLVAAAWVSRQVSNYYHNDRARAERMLEIAPDHPTLLTSLAWDYYEEGDLQRAFELTSEELRRHSDNDTAYFRAINLRALCRYQLSHDVAGAEADIQAAIAREPKYVRSYENLAGIYRQENRPAEAQQQLKKALEVAPEYTPALKQLARLYWRNDRPEKAIPLFERAVQVSRGYDIEALNALGEIELQQGHFNAAIDRYTALLKWHPDDLIARYNLAMGYYGQGSTADAEAELLQVLERDPAGYQARYLLAKILLEQQQLPQALEQYLQLLDHHPTDRTALRETAILLQAMGRYPEICALYDRARQKDPSADLLGELSLAAWWAGMDSAATLAEQALAADPQLWSARCTRLLVAIRRGDGAQIDTAWQELLATAPAQPQWIPLLDALDHARQVDADSPWPYYVSARVAGKLGDEPAAKQMQQEFCRRQPDVFWQQRLTALLAEDQTGLAPASR
ncbi:MAG: Lipopolysaccharide assembly protein B [Phycisphaerae bacterium]|nr:Lipopolysaccharide assembly protein B [Phycisphaerae bacterium]